MDLTQHYISNMHLKDGKPVYGKDGVPADYLYTPRGEKTQKALDDLKREYPGKVSFSKEVTDAYVKGQKRRGQLGGAALGGTAGMMLGAGLGSNLIRNRNVRMATGGVLGAGLGGYVGGLHQGGKARKDVDKVIKANETQIASFLHTLANENNINVALRNEDGSKRMVISPRQEKKAMFYEKLASAKKEKKRPSRRVGRAIGATLGGAGGGALAAAATLPFHTGKYAPHAISGGAGLSAGLGAAALGRDNLGAYGGGIAGGIAGSHLGGKLLKDKLPLGGHLLGAGLGALAGNRIGSYAHERIQPRKG